MYRSNPQESVSQETDSSRDDSPSNSTDKIKYYETQAYKDRRHPNGERVHSHCLLNLPYADTDQSEPKQATGLMIFNLRGCCLYLEPSLSSDEVKRLFPENQRITLTDLILSGVDSTKMAINNLSARRVRLLTDENGSGIVLRFVNLTADQLYMLSSIYYLNSGTN